MSDKINEVDYQVKNLKKVTSNNMITKRVLICFHGLETNKRHDLQDFKEYFDKYNKNSDFEVVLKSLYDVGDKKTYHSKKMYKRACNAIEEYLKKDYKVYVLGYSFSCGIASRLAKEYKKIQKIVLVSPIISLFKTTLLANYIKVAWQYARLRMKYGKKSKVVLDKTKQRGVVKLSVAVSNSLSQNRKYFKKIRCGAFVLRGKDDEYSLDSTFSFIMKNNDGNNMRFKIYPQGNHVMIMFNEKATECYKDIIKYVFDTTISTESVSFNE